MTKRQRHRSNISKHIKTTHKKSTINRKIVYKKVDRNLKDINQIISKEMHKAHKMTNENPETQENNKIEL